MFADKQTPTSEALASIDKSVSQFESVGVSRSCFCVSKIKQDSANLAQPKRLQKHMRCLGRFMAHAALV
ncbi:hypothetical protein [Helicobacter pylori]|uniref:hypothetical protein n=1 Tax=Helicobacter pylori TaxID=210 RepID=UPI000992052F|nr:hypothetical protein [Helicobacter pylori]OOQ10506.1 hypothetical protein B0X45_02845 [Helicobacter pylori]PDW82133.1 hypothetical protein BB384_07820 [Helicobacter pylori]